MDPFKRYLEIPFENVTVVSSWEEFENALKVLERTLGKIKADGGYVSPPLFRGHSNREWALESTLNRATGKSEFSIADYFEIATKVCTSLGNSLSTAPKFLEFADTSDFDLILRSENIEKYTRPLAYLRHHGFPSPLLDWTQSKEVAAYFAFRERSQHEFVSIYILLEYLSVGKIVNASKPRVISIGNSIEVHHRHKNQQSEYTFCTVKNGSTLFFTDHKLVLAKNNKPQDITLKFDIPSKERAKVIGYLFNSGITDSFIMGASEDSLIKSLSYKFFS